MPRKKGAKSKSGIPTKGLPEAIRLVKMVYDNAGDNSMSFQEMANFMKLPKGISTQVVGAIKEYELIEKSDLGWRVSELGRKAILGNIESVKQVFTKNPIFADLYSKFGDKKVMPGLIENHIRSEYKKGENVTLILNRFQEGSTYIKNLEMGKLVYEEPEVDIKKWIKVFQLKNALNPTKVEISKLAEIIAIDFKDFNDIAISNLAKSIGENKSNNDVLKVLVDNLISIAIEEYPEVAYTLFEKPEGTNEEESKKE